VEGDDIWLQVHEVMQTSRLEREWLDECKSYNEDFRHIWIRDWTDNWWFIFEKVFSLLLVDEWSLRQVSDGIIEMVKMWWWFTWTSWDFTHL
jgi:hypothetical protein